jgi:thiol-disulfide isomerase/thioredoxin
MAHFAAGLPPPAPRPGALPMRFRNTLALGLLLAVSAVSAKLAPGIVPPDYLGKNPEREEIRLSQFKGRVVLITFWASWCGPCRRELPVLDSLKKTAGDRLEIIAVNVKDTPQDYRFIRRQLKDSPLIFTHDSRGDISEGYGVHSYPNLYLIDQSGKIASVHVGYGEGSLDHLLKDVNKLLMQPATTTAGSH